MPFNRTKLYNLADQIENVIQALKFADRQQDAIFDGDTAATVKGIINFFVLTPLVDVHNEIIETMLVNRVDTCGNGYLGNERKTRDTIQQRALRRDVVLIERELLAVVTYLCDPYLNDENPKLSDFARTGIRRAAEIISEIVDELHK